jgi:membrane-bound serine protease (ClpP class)
MPMNIFKYLTLLFFSFNLFAADTYQLNKIHSLDVQTSINPAVFNFIETELNKLDSTKGDALLIKLNTPGGLVTTTKEIMSKIGSTSIPVFVWITPEGASATSAGAIIASSAHILVMSEGTNIGAATPVGIGKDIDKKSDGRKKAINDLVALTTSLAKTRGRNPEPFEKMISEAKSYDAKEALKKNIIDGIVNTKSDFAKFLNDRTVRVLGKDIILKSSGATEFVEKEMDPGQWILSIFANPSTAYILFMIGAALLYFEFQAPGGMVAGSIGVVCLILAGIGFQVLPLNVGALGLIILSFVLFILEIYITSYGILTLGGIASLVFGSLFLFRTENAYMEIELPLILSTSGAVIAYVIFVATYWIKTRHIRKGYYSEVDHKGVVTSILKDEEGDYLYQVKVNGEIWKANSPNKYEIGDEILVISENSDEMILTIK